jgi:hypothetical protein
MTFVRLLPVILSALVLAAHFLRGGHLGLVLISLAALLILLVREAWAARLVQALLLLGSLEWIRTMLHLMGERRSLGEPWMRMAAILGSVVLFTAASALVFQTARMKERYSAGTPEKEGGAAGAEGS